LKYYLAIDNVRLGTVRALPDVVRLLNHALLPYW